MKKTYVLDTNVLLSDHNALDSFEDNDIVIPLAVLEELDKHKIRQDEVGANARTINRKLDTLRQFGSLLTGILTNGGGILRVAGISNLTISNLPPEFQGQKVDNMIIAYALEHQKEQYILVSKDINVRIKCDAIGVTCEDYKKSQVITSTDSMYSGVVKKEATQEFIDSIHEAAKNSTTVLAPSDWTLLPNEIVIIKSFGSTSGSTIVRTLKNNELQLVSKHNNCFGLTPRNKEQNFSLDLLYDDKIKLITLSGIAGSGKSLIALAAGLDQNTILGDKKIAKYNKIVVARSLQPVGKDTGFLPGTLIEKLAPWQGPTIDNLNYLMTKGDKKERFKPQQKHNSSDGQQLDPYLALLMEKGVIELASISHIRGRSIPNSYFIVEEAQNLSLLEIKTIITRIGEGTKIVLVGDIDQIDNNYVDKYSNGLTHVIEKFKHSELAAHITLKKGERSPISALAASLL